jgi:hypothetical protein
LSARLDAGGRSVVLKIDSGGRLQITQAEALGDQAADPIIIGDVRLTVTDRTTRHQIMRGIVQTLDQFRAIIDSVSRAQASDRPPTV